MVAAIHDALRRNMLRDDRIVLLNLITLAVEVAALLRMVPLVAGLTR